MESKAIGTKNISFLVNVTSMLKGNFCANFVVALVEIGKKWGQENGDILVLFSWNNYNYKLL